MCREKVYIPITKPYISLIGNKKRVTDTVITWNDKASDKDMNGVELGTYRTATVAIDSDYSFLLIFATSSCDIDLLLKNQQCVITSTAESFGAIAAHHRVSPNDDTGFSFVRSVINGSGKVLKDITEASQVPRFGPLVDTGWP